MFTQFINSITGQTPQKSDEILLHPCQSGGLFGVSVMVHFRRHVDFAFLFVRRARAAACVDAWAWVERIGNRLLNHRVLSLNELPIMGQMISQVSIYEPGL